MATLQDFRDERLRKLAELKELGINPYPAKANRTHNTAQIVAEFDELENKTVVIAGRIVSIRKFGKMAFIVIRDMSGQVQLFVRKGDSAEQANRDNSELIMPQEIALLDTGDFVECRGEVIKTQTGEISVNCREFRLLTKALRPMPSVQEGFTDKEQRLRRRYVDMNVNIDVRKRFERRSEFWKATRDFLNQEGFLEVNIPVLEHTTGGADANPFVTNMDALDQDFYLRISHELPLKRLIGAGFEKVYDLGPRFRNENYSDEHLPEHIAMEWYWAYADWKDGMPFMERMFRFVLEQTFGTLQFTVGDMKVDMSNDWEHWDYAEVIKKHYDIDVFDCTIEQVQQALKDNNLEVEKTNSIPRGIDKLWKKIRATVAGPVWLINTPAFISPLSKSNKEDPRKTERAQAVIAGSELINMFSELNDPVDQLNRFVEQQQMRDGGDDEAMMLDIDYVEMLEYGIPPTCGMGYSERVFWIFEGVTAREGVPFPQLRSEIDEVTKSIYPELNLGE
jgi:lysyl-tRNA synthetase class 2